MPRPFSLLAPLFVITLVTLTACAGAQDPAAPRYASDAAARAAEHGPLLLKLQSLLGLSVFTLIAFAVGKAQNRRSRVN